MSIHHHNIATRKINIYKSSYHCHIKRLIKYVYYFFPSNIPATFAALELFTFNITRLKKRNDILTYNKAINK
jgi:hypothetical protein